MGDIYLFPLLSFRVENWSLFSPEEQENIFWTVSTGQEGPFSYVPTEFPFTSVSTVSRGHPSLLSLDGLNFVVCFPEVEHHRSSRNCIRWNTPGICRIINKIYGKAYGDALIMLHCIARGYTALQIWVWSVSNIRIHVEYTKLFLGSKYLIMRSKYFH